MPHLIGRCLSWCKTRGTSSDSFRLFRTLFPSLRVSTFYIITLFYLQNTVSLLQLASEEARIECAPLLQIGSVDCCLSHWSPSWLLLIVSQCLLLASGGSLVVAREKLSQVAGLNQKLKLRRRAGGGGGSDEMASGRLFWARAIH